MLRFSPLFAFAFFICHFAIAEGTHELAPNGSIIVNGNATTDLAALHINNPNYNSFAAYDNPDPQGRLYLHIVDPTKECVFVGFSFAHPNVTSPAPPQINFEFRIKDPNGNVVFGPVPVSPAQANITTWAEAYTGPEQINGSGGYMAIEIASADLASQGWSGTGDYYIEFRNDDGTDLLIDFWDITVADCSGGTPTAKPGRLWSYNWSIFAVNDFGFPNRPFNGAFYVCAPDPDNIHASFVTKIDFNGSGFQPAAFNIAFNSFGSMNTGNVAEDRKSVENINATRAEYSIFLNDPVEICETAEIGQIELLGVSRCDAESYCIKFIASKAGQVDLLLDFDGHDNIYTPGTADLKITQNVTSDQVGIATCINWDGKDGLGNSISENSGTQIPVIIAFAQGIYHFPIYDAEYMINGVKLYAVRPIAPEPLLYYDDTNITVPSGSGEPNQQLSGCATPCHRWTNYTMPNTPGFGNLHTINSWWFSQLIVRQDIFFLPAYYTCGIEGPEHFCAGGTSQLTLKPETLPAGATGPEIVSTTWTGPGIVGSDSGQEITLDKPGMYTVEMVWVTGLGDTCSSGCAIEVIQDPPGTASESYLIHKGDQVEINGEVYTEGGQYTQLLTTAEGCDSILNITVVVLNTVVYYDLDACWSFMSDSSHIDYSEFVPAYLEPLPCADISGSTVYRTPPEENKHSCTPGVNNSLAMCVSSLDTCEFVAGSSAAVLFELNISPDADTAVQVDAVQFYTQAPANYNWISGPTGVNNFPTFFGIRVLKNGTEIFRQEDIPTTPTWTLRRWDFTGMEDFIVDEATTFTFELLPYCLIGNGSDVAAWDMDDISIEASCVSPAALDPFISGVVRAMNQKIVSKVEVRLGQDPEVSDYTSALSDTKGQYLFEKVSRRNDYFVQPHRDGDDLNGVSTLDLIAIQKHLLGIQTFTSPYQFIAADANHSNTVSAFDLVVLKKLILGYYTELPFTESWRFGYAHQDLDLSNPWIIMETVPVEYLLSDINDMDFTAVKIGDINLDAKGNAQDASVDARGVDDFTVLVKKELSGTADIGDLNFTSTTSTELEGLQMTFFTGHGNVELVPGLLPVSRDDYRVDEAGNVTLSWYGQAIAVEPGSVLFSVRTNDFVSDVFHDLHLLGDRIKPEMYKDDQAIPVTMQLENHVPVLEKDQILSLVPNPARTDVQLRTELSEDGPVTIRIIDPSGRICFEVTQDGIRGMNVFTINPRECQAGEGIVFVQLKTKHSVAVKPLVILR